MESHLIEFKLEGILIEWRNGFKIKFGKLNPTNNEWIRKNK